MEERKVWISILFVGLLFHLSAAAVMPLGLDAHIHVNYVTDSLSDDEASLDWGTVRTDGANYSTPSKVEADDKWAVWHTIIGVWLSIFGVSLMSLHILSLVISLSCLAVIYLLTSKLWGANNALALTAICSIYSPLVRASGRLYQENIVLMLATLAVYGLLQTRRKQNSTWWLFASFMSLMAILSIKGINPAYSIVLFFPVAYSVVNNLNIKPLKIPALLAGCLLFSLLMTWFRTDSITVDTIYFLFRTLFVGGLIYVIMATLLFSANYQEKSAESDFLLLLCQLVFIAITGYIVMLLEVEKISLGVSASLTAEQFSYIFRYLTVLVVPLWWSYLARSKQNEITLLDNPRRYAMVYAIILILLLNATMLQTTRGMEYVGEEIADSIEEGDNILYISEPYHAMHRLYTLQISVDPNHDRNITGYWADYTYNWSHIVTDSQIDWVIFTDDWQSYLDDDWTEFDTDTDYIVYHRKSSV